MNGNFVCNIAISFKLSSFPFFVFTQQTSRSSSSRLLSKTPSSSSWRRWGTCGLFTPTLCHPTPPESCFIYLPWKKKAFSGEPTCHFLCWLLPLRISRPQPTLPGMNAAQEAHNKASMHVWAWIISGAWEGKGEGGGGVGGLKGGWVVRWISEILMSIIIKGDERHIRDSRQWGCKTPLDLTSKLALTWGKHGSTCTVPASSGTEISLRRPRHDSTAELSSHINKRYSEGTVCICHESPAPWNQEIQRREWDKQGFTLFFIWHTGRSRRKWWWWWRRCVWFHLTMQQLIFFFFVLLSLSLPLSSF